MSIFQGFFASGSHSVPTSKPFNKLSKHSKKASLSLSTQLNPHHPSAFFGSRRQLEKEDEAVYGPPSPRPNPPPGTITTQQHHPHPPFYPPLSSASQASSPTFAPDSASISSPTCVPDSASPTDELFISQQYPPIHTRHYPFFEEKLTSSIGMNKSTHSNQHQSIPLGIAHTWARIERNLNKSLPELAETLSYPADEISLTRLDNALSTHRLKLPQSVKNSLLIHDGQDVYSRSSVATDGLIWGLWLMSCEEIEIEWGFWRKLDGGQLPGDAFTASDFTSIHQNHHHQQQQQHNNIDGNMTSCPAGWVREIYSHPGWLPLLSDRVGNYIGVDLSPPMIIESEEGYIGGGQGNARPAPGQVIAFGREIDEKVVLWRGDGVEGWAHWLAAFADDLEQGNFAHPGGLRPGRRRSNREEEEDSGWQEGDEEDEDEEEGLGEVGYFTGSNGYGVASDEAEFKGWKLAGEYRGMSIIEALCARSKRRWAEIGLYSSQNPNLPEPTSNPTRSSIASGSSSAVHPKSAAVDQQQPETPIAFVTPPSPRPSTEQTDRLDTFNSTSGLTPCPPTTITRPRRPPPPAPATITLPTMDDMIRAGAEDYDDEPEIEEEESPSPASSVGRFVAAGFRRMSEEVTATSNNARPEEEQIGMSPIRKDKGSRLEDLSLVDQPKET